MMSRIPPKLCQVERERQPFLRLDRAQCKLTCEVYRKVYIRVTCFPPTYAPRTPPHLRVNSLSASKWQVYPVHLLKQI